MTSCISESATPNTNNSSGKEKQVQEFIYFIKKYVIPMNPAWIVVATRSKTGIDRHKLKSISHWDDAFLYCAKDDGGLFKISWDQVGYIDSPE